jgi:Carboxypeptidase regulatory-like domain
MKRSLLLMCASFLLLATAAFAQASGSLMVMVKSAPGSATTAAPVAGAAVIVAHWTNDGMHPKMVQDQTATTNQMGTCTLQLPPGMYDVFVAASELAPSAFRREVTAGGTTSISANLKPAPSHLKPVN